MNMQQGLELNGAPVPGHVITGEIEADSKTEQHRAVLEALVQELPGKTSAEYANRPECKGFGVSKHERKTEISRRMPELVKELRVREAKKKKCPIVNRPCKTWQPKVFKKSVSGGASA